MPFSGYLKIIIDIVHLGSISSIIMLKEIRGIHELLKK